MVKAICAFFASPRSEAWKTLTQAQIAARCRARAETAIALAEDTSSVPLLETAEAWLQLADDIAWAAEKTAIPRLRGVAALRQLGEVT